MKEMAIDQAAFTRAEQLRILTKAFFRVGEASPQIKAKELDGQLQKLYINTPEALKSALNDSRIFTEFLQKLVPGMLLPAIEAELQKADVGAGWRLRKQLATKPPWVPPPRKRRSFEITRFDVSQLSAIDCVSLTFRAKIFMIMKVKDGALDNDLMRSYDGFPIDAEGRPTFRPSAAWYLQQLHFLNGRQLTEIESKVTVLGKDLQLIKRVEGEFFETFELQNFPFDKQDLTFTVSHHSANEGPVPVLFTVAEEPELSVDVDGFAYKDTWNLSPDVDQNIFTFAATAKRTYPGVNFRLKVARRPGFVLYNVYTPTMTVALLSTVTYFQDFSDITANVTLSLTILLTAVAFKFASAGSLPQISYLTTIDKFVMMSFYQLVTATIATSVTGLLKNWIGGPFDDEEWLQWLNQIFFAIQLCLWVLCQVWFFSAMRRGRQSKSAAEMEIDQKGTLTRQATGISEPSDKSNSRLSSSLWNGTGKSFGVMGRLSFAAGRSSVHPERGSTMSSLNGHENNAAAASSRTGGNKNPTQLVRRISVVSRKRLNTPSEKSWNAAKRSLGMVQAVNALNVGLSYDGEGDDPQMHSRVVRPQELNSDLMKMVT